MKSPRSSAKKSRQKGIGEISPVDRERLAGQLRRLRSLFQEIADAYTARVSAMIQRLVDPFEETDTVDSEAGGSLSVEKYEQIFTSIRALDVRPSKGRRRDLKRIEELAAEIEDIINS